MYRETIKHQIELMQAYLDGKSIEFRIKFADPNWKDVNEPSWDFVSFEYRVKEDQELKAMNVYLHGCGNSYPYDDNICPEIRKGFRAVIDAVKNGEIQ